jgi:2'-5' RNA ligase
MYSLWLMPCAAQAADLHALVVKLSAAFATPPFLPHMTVQGDLTARLAEVSAMAATVAAALPAQHWPVRGIEQSDAWFRAFYLAFEPRPAFTDALAAAERASGTRNGLSPFPHVSLAYGTLDATRKEALRNSIAARVPAAITFDRLVVALSGSTVGVPSWRALETFALAQG